MKKIQISPSILSADFSQLGKEIKKLEDSGADMIHVDVMDGHFVPNLTIGPPVIKALKKNSSLPFDVHLMITPVHKYIESYASAGADIITIHPEATNDLLGSINKIKVEKLLDQIDLILIMSVNPGFGGQKFMPEVLDKVKKLDEIRKNLKLNFVIEIDGGINFENSKLAIKSGVDILVSGTTIFKNNNGDIKKNIDLLRSI